MGCHVELDIDQPLIRSQLIRLVSFIHIGKAMVFITLYAIVPELFILITGIILLEVLVARWFWSMKIEAWGITLGFALLHIIFPVTFSVSPAVWFLLVSSSLIEIPILWKIRSNGYYSFITMAILDKETKRTAGALQKMMFNLTFLAQILKTVFIWIGIGIVSTQIGILDSIPWLGIIPQIPFAALFGFIDILTTIAFKRSKDWGFHLLTTMSVLGFVEYMVTGSFPVLLLSIWIIMLLTPCWVKDGFYPNLLTQVKQETGV
ncbi:MAG: membrane protein of unknown function [Candidatus Thorarchaeota archaeon]|nr:MAG: membrane protein of unknown function [Candidatus Thorarchaeota archaeon]